MLESPPILNILILQGTDLDDLTFQLNHGVRVRCGVSVSTSPAIVKIDEMGVAMQTGEILTIGCQELELAAPLNPTDRTLQLTALPVELKAGSMLTGSPIDITGWNFAGKLEHPSGGVVNFDCSIVDALEGLFQTSLSKTVTSAMVATCSWEDLLGIDIALLGQSSEILSDFYLPDEIKRIKKLCNRAYRWDIESTDTNLKTKRRAEGLAIVTRERT
jgi:hypothetical protein